MNASGVVSNLELTPFAQPARHPNTPVMPFATPTKKASFLNPSVIIKDGNSSVISFQSYVAPYATLDSRGRARSRSATARTSWTTPSSSRIRGTPM
jgi:hypothetical protein